MVGLVEAFLHAPLHRLGLFLKAFLVWSLVSRYREFGDERFGSEDGRMTAWSNYMPCLESILMRIDALVDKSLKKPTFRAAA